MNTPAVSSPLLCPSLTSLPLDLRKSVLQVSIPCVLHQSSSIRFLCIFKPTQRLESCTQADVSLIEKEKGSCNFIIQLQLYMTDLGPVWLQLHHPLGVYQCRVGLPRLQMCQRAVAIETVVRVGKGYGFLVQLYGFVKLALLQCRVPAQPQFVGLRRNTPRPTQQDD